MSFGLIGMRERIRFWKGELTFIGGRNIRNYSKGERSTATKKGGVMIKVLSKDIKHCHNSVMLYKEHLNLKM